MVGRDWRAPGSEALFAVAPPDLFHRDSAPCPSRGGEPQEAGGDAFAGWEVGLARRSPPAEYRNIGFDISKSSSEPDIPKWNAKEERKKHSPPPSNKHSGMSVASSLIFSLMLSRRRRSTALWLSRRRRRFSCARREALDSVGELVM